MQHEYNTETKSEAILIYFAVKKKRYSSRIMRSVSMKNFKKQSQSEFFFFSCDQFISSLFHANYVQRLLCESMNNISQP